jgi:UDP-N-acetylmuramoyl-tripeptide--D-alanyl-D-alanine ligase
MTSFIETLYTRFLKSAGVSTDTRTLKPGMIFFGISGPNFSGSAYATKALEAGASYAVVDNPEYATDARILLADDSLKALQELAIYHRMRFAGRVFGITGSNGKTTTKELIRDVLRKKYKVHATKGNLNNHIGVPLTILQWPKELDIAVVEMGANHVGEIGALSEIARPTHGLITNIGYAHTEGFGGIEGVLRGKTELFDFLKKTGGVPFINQQDERLLPITRRFDEAVPFPPEDLRVEVRVGLLHLAFGTVTAQTQLTGLYNLGNLAAAIAVGRYFRVPDEKIAEALAAYTPENLRSQVVKKGTTTIILDAYNANPSSMQAALENLASFAGKKAAILGDMNELDDPDAEHLKLGHTLAGMNLETVVLVGNKIRVASQMLPSAVCFDTTEELREWLATQSFADTTLLLKASRTIGLERAVEAIRQD